jgi:hypothetical protein
MVALVFVVAIVTQWLAFQLSLAAPTLRPRRRRPDRVLRDVQLRRRDRGAAAAVRAHRAGAAAVRLATTILLLPHRAGRRQRAHPGCADLLDGPADGGFDQVLRFSVDKATYELLYLPLPQPQRGAVKAAIDIIVNRFADATGAVLLGLATQGFFMLGGLGFGLRGTAAVNLVLAGVWVALAWRCGPSTCADPADDSFAPDGSRAQRGGAARDADLRRHAPAARSGLPEDVLATLDLLGRAVAAQVPGSLRPLLGHPAPEVRRRVLAMLARAGGPGDRGRGARACCATPTSACGPRRCCTSAASTAPIRSP